MTKLNRTEIIYDFYFVTNPEVFEKQDIEGSLFIKIFKSLYEKLISNKSVPTKIISFM